MTGDEAKAIVLAVYPAAHASAYGIGRNSAITFLIYPYTYYSFRSEFGIFIRQRNSQLTFEECTDRCWIKAALRIMVQLKEKFES